MNFATTKEKILKYLDFKGISKASFYKKTGIKRGFLDSDKLKGAVSDSFLAKILASYEDISLIWLITGQGKMILSGNLSSNVSSNNDNSLIENTPKNTPNSTPNNKIAGNTAGNSKNFEYNLEVSTPTEVLANEEITQYPSRTDSYKQDQRIPLYDMDAAAGMLPMLQDLDSKEPLDYLYIPNAPACDGAIFATGDSMYPLLKSGDILAFKIINDIQNNVFWGEMYILYIDVEGDLFRVVKYVQKGKDKYHYRLVSQNKHHQDKEVRIDKIKAMAQVKLSIRMN